MPQHKFCITFPLASNSYHHDVIGTTKAPEGSMTRSRQAFRRSTGGPAPYMNVKSNNDSTVDSSLNESSCSERDCPVAKKQRRKKKFQWTEDIFDLKEGEGNGYLDFDDGQTFRGRIKDGEYQTGEFILYCAIKWNVHHFLITKKRDS